MIKPEVISSTPMETLEEACTYFKQVLQEHLDKKRDITLFAIAVVGGRLKVVEGLPKMIKLEGTIINVFTQQGGTSKKTGEAFADRDKIQLMGELELPNGSIKHELIDLTVEDGKAYVNLKNKRVSIPCGALASGRNVIFYVAKGATPKLLNQV